MLFFRKKKKLSDAIILTIALVIPQIAGLVGSLYTIPNIKSWHSSLNKPWFSPPNWIFAPVWIILFLLMGIASFLVYKSNSKLKNKALQLYFAQLTLNIMWSVVFFGAHNPLGGFLVIAALWIEIAYTMDVFYKVNKTAGYLFIPYFFNQYAPALIILDSIIC